MTFPSKMGANMKFNLPIYHTLRYKKKKDKNILVGLNWYRNAHYQISNKVKQHYTHMVAMKLQNQRRELSKYRINYTLFYRRSCDLMNIVSVIDKFVNDALVKSGIVSDDNVSFYVGMSAEVGGTGS